MSIIIRYHPHKSYNTVFYKLFYTKNTLVHKDSLWTSVPISGERLMVGGTPSGHCRAGIQNGSREPGARGRFSMGNLDCQRQKLSKNK